MGKMFTGFIVAAFVVALGEPAFAATETVKGQIVDQACYKMDKSNTCVDHKMPKGDTKDCAIGCAKAGRPMASLAPEGQVYEIARGLAVEKNAKIIDHVSHTLDV